MKSPKKPSKEPSFPSQDESRRSNVLMEQMLSKFDAFGEALSAVREDVNSMKPALHAVKEDVTVLKAAANTHTQEIRSLKEVVQRHTKAIQDNTEAIHSMQADLKNINQRVEVVEVKLAS